MEAQYFSHDYNARRSEKIVELRLAMGNEGVGIYWGIVEYLYEHENVVRASKMAVLADDVRCEEEKVRRVLTEFELFETDGERYWSESIARRMEMRMATSARNSANAKGKKVEEKSEEKVIEKRGEKGEEKRSVEEVKKVAEESLSGAGTTAKESLSETGAVASESQGKIKDKEKEKENYIIPPTPLGGEAKVRGMKFDFEVGKAPAWMSSAMAAAFKGWIDYKRARRSGYANEVTARTCYEELMRWANGDVQVAQQRIRVAMANNWQGLVFDDRSRLMGGMSTIGNVGTLIGRRMTEF